MSKEISPVVNFDLNKIVFSEAKESSIPGSYRINIGVKYPNGTVGPLIFSTDSVYSFGIQENKSLDKPVRTSGYSVPLCLWNTDGPTEHQKNFIDTLEKVSNHIKQYVLKPEVKKSVKKFDLVESDLRKFSPLWWKKDENNEIVPGKGPNLYPKLMTNKDLQIYTVVADSNGRDLDPLSLIGVKGTVRACIKIESVFVGSKISLQVKVLELEVQTQGNQRSRLLCKEAPAETVVIEARDTLNPLQTLAASDDEESADEESADEEEPVVNAPVVPSTPATGTSGKPSNRGGRRLVK